MTRSRIRWYLRALATVAVVGVILLTLSFAQTASAEPGFTCNPEPGHGGPGCHVTPATSPPATSPPTASSPAPVTTAKPTSSGSQSVSDTTPPAAEPTTTVEASTTTTIPGNLVAGTSGSGGSDTGIGRRIAIVWMTTLGGLAAASLIAFAGISIKRVRARRRARFVSAGAAGPVRFVLAERLAHWFYALCFLAAGVTGALMWIPSTERWMAEASYTVSKYHGYVGLAMVIVPFIIFLVLDRRRLTQNRREFDSFDANDRRWLWRALSGGMFRGKQMPPQGRFNAGQKVNTHLVAALAIGFVITGILLLLRLDLPSWLVSGARFAHQVIAVTSGVLLLGHIGMALFTKHGRGGLKAMITGIMPARFAREGHSLWYSEWLDRNVEERS